MKPRALLLSPEAPYPLRGGGSLRTASLLHYLAERYTVDAILFRQPGEADPRAAIPSGLLSETLICDLPFHARHPAARAWRNLKRYARGAPPLPDRFSGFPDEIGAFARNSRYQLGVIEHMWCAPYCDALRPSCDRLILDLHNVESTLHQTCAAAEPFPVSLLHRRFATAARELERRWLPHFDLVLTASEHDCRLAGSLAPQTRTAAYPNALPEREPPAVPTLPQIVFSGNFDYHPNRTAVAWFASQVWPLVRARHPDLTWVLAGKNDHAVHKWTAGDPTIRCTGEVQDTLPVIAGSLVAVVPLLSGSGTRLKVLEAWSCGVPVVSTTIGAQGLPGRNEENLLIADTPRAFADSIYRLIESPVDRQRIGAAGRELCDSLFTWRTSRKLLAELGI